MLHRCRRLTVVLCVVVVVLGCAFYIQHGYLGLPFRPKIRFPGYNYSNSSILLMQSSRDGRQPSFHSPNNITATWDSFTVENLKWTTVYHSGSNSNKPHFFSAYYDDRVRAPGRPAVLVLGYHPKTMSKITLYCVLTFSNRTSLCLNQPATMTMIKGNRYIWNKLFDPMSYSCRLGCDSDCAEDAIPVFVAISSSSDCTAASDNIPVHNRPPRSSNLDDFGVCVQTPVFRKSLQQIIEFIEMNRMLGAKQFIIYVTDIRKQVLSFLQRQYSLPGLLQIVRWSNRAHLFYHGELLIMHDCLYRIMKRVKYVVFVDLDELILPSRHSSWPGMMAELENNTRIAAFVFNNVYFTKNYHQGIKMKAPCKEMNLPKFFHWTRRYLCKYHIFQRSKYIVNPDRVVDLDIHGVHPFSGFFQYSVPESIGINAHYRFRTSSDCTNKKTVIDTTILKFQPQVMKQLEQKMCVHSNWTNNKSN